MSNVRVRQRRGACCFHPLDTMGRRRMVRTQPPRLPPRQAPALSAFETEPLAYKRSRAKNVSAVIRPGLCCQTTTHAAASAAHALAHHALACHTTAPCVACARPRTPCTATHGWRRAKQSRGRAKGTSRPGLHDGPAPRTAWLWWRCDERHRPRAPTCGRCSFLFAEPLVRRHHPHVGGRAAVVPGRAWSQRAV